METLSIPLISDVFFGDGAKEQLVSRLQEANVLGADLVVLPEIACDS